MKKHLETLKRNRSGGFTLVELIVVLIILAILAALLIPSLTGYIDKAKQKQIVAETRSCVMAAQTLADEKYAIGRTDEAVQNYLTGTDGKVVTDLAETKGKVTSVTVEKGVITRLVYQNGSDQCTYDKNKDGAEKYEIGS